VDQIEIDTNDRTGHANQLAGQHRDIAGAASHIENPHTLLDARASQQPLRGRPEDGRWLIKRRISAGECPRM
jgi:hypothetical protein